MTGRRRALLDESQRAVFGLITEDDLLHYVRNTANTLGWLFYHPTYSIKGPSGFPDVVLVEKATGRTVVAELKREGLWPTTDRLKAGKFLQGQAAWLRALQQGPVEAYLWWPSDARDIADLLVGGPTPGMACIARLDEFLTKEALLDHR